LSDKIEGRKVVDVAKGQVGAGDLPIESIRSELHSLADPQKALILQRFFKTGPGEYGEGDRFIGVGVPKIRKLVKRYSGTGLETTKALLASPIHEERLLALLMLISQFQKGDTWDREEIYRLYLTESHHVNNWDLVDVTAEHIVGAYLWKRDKEPLVLLARSESLWERRISIVATFHYIKKGTPEITFLIADHLLGDKHDLIHKAVGWMLREVGKRCGQDLEESYLGKHYGRMPRTMLRYAIERFPEEKRRAYLHGLLPPYP
jgi:3-methyladenine DNA glycosylase AlkD